MPFFRHGRGRPPHPDVLTPAEWRVLEQVRERRTNAEIAVRLGVSVNTVRTHVSSMLAKLGVADRAELARWRGEPALASRTALGRAAPVGMTPLAWLGQRWEQAAAGVKAIATAGVVVAVGTAIVGVASVAPSMSRDAEVTPTVTPPAAVASQPPPTESPSAMAAALASLTPTPKPRFEPSPGARTISGLFSDPRPTLPDEYRSLDPNPRDSFGPWNGEDVVLYDLETMTETNLGPGGGAQFTPDGEALYWIATTELYASTDIGQELWMLDLSSGERRSLGSARHAVWVDAEHFGVILPGGNQWELVTVSTGERVALSGPAKGVYPGTRLSEAGGFRLEAVPTDPEHGYPYEYTAYRVVDITGRLAPLEFDAVDVRLTADGKLFLLTPPVDLKPQIGAFIGPAAKRGMSNLFEVDPRTGVGRWIASAEISTWGTTLAANEQYVAWTENYCNISPQLHASDGNTRVYNRANGKLIELDQGLYVTAITPDGELAAGTFGADALIDIESLSYTVKFDARDRAWSPDFRYTAVGMTGGHGGVCGA